MKYLATAVALLTFPPLAAQAQDTGWDFGARLYGWTAGLDTGIDTPFGKLESDLSIGDVLSDLSAVFMASLEARHGRWSFIGDIVYADITVPKNNPLDGAFSKAAVEPKLTAVTALAAYRVYQQDNIDVDLGAGLRYVDLNTEVRLSAGTYPAETLNSDESWTDPIVGLRLSGDFNENWYGRAYVDAGGQWSGDSSTWQAMALGGYRFNPAWSVEFGYRYMHIENEIDGSDLSIDLSGPMIGVAARF